MWPCPAGAEATVTFTEPIRSTATVALAIAPFFGPALARCSAVSTVLM
jgi:hypothetical protein